MSLESDVIRIAICDDEKQFRVMLKAEIEKYYRKKHAIEISEFESGEELLELGVEVFKFDALFLDVSMGKKGGIATAQAIRKVSSDIVIVFITAILKTWNKGYEVGAFRYIIKDPKTFQPLLKECLDSLTRKLFCDNPMIEIGSGKGKTEVPVRKIVYVESNGHVLECHICDDGKMLVCYTRSRLDKYETTFLKHGFIRIHKSFLVNPEYISKIRNYKATLYASNIELPISRDRYGFVKASFALVKEDI